METNQTFKRGILTWEEVLSFFDYPVITEKMQFQGENAMLITAKGKLRPITAVACDRFKTGSYAILNTFTDPITPQNLQTLYTSVRDLITTEFPKHTVESVYASACGGYQRVVIDTGEDFINSELTIKLFFESSINGKLTNRVGVNVFTKDGVDLFVEKDIEFGSVLTFGDIDKIRYTISDIEMYSRITLAVTYSDDFYKATYKRWVETAPMPESYRKILASCVEFLTDSPNQIGFFTHVKTAFSKLDDNPERMSAIRKAIIQYFKDDTFFGKLTLH